MLWLQKFFFIYLKCEFHTELNGKLKMKKQKTHVKKKKAQCIFNCFHLKALVSAHKGYSVLPRHMV